MQATETATQAISATVKQSELKAALGKASKAVASRSTLPVLSNILLDAQDGMLHLSATNLDIAVTLSIPAQTTQDGSTTIPASLMSAFVGALPMGDVVISPLPNAIEGLQLRSGSTKANFRGMSAQEFPRIPTMEGAIPLLTLDVGTFRAVVHDTAVCAANDMGRPIFTAICVNVQDESVDFVAADTFRLGIHTIQQRNSTPMQILIPAINMRLVADILPTNGEVTIYVTPDSNQVFFVAEGLTITSRLLEGQYAAYRAIVPNESVTRVTLNRASLADALKAISPFAKNEAMSNTIRLTVTPAESELMPGVLTVAAHQDEYGDGEASVDVVVDGPAMSILFNHHYLSDALNVIDTAEVVLSLKTSTNPGIIQPQGRDDYLYVIMPLYSRG